ncbi:MAG: phosphoenolpyruvate kinase, partial [Myxococcota bacterium]|nr:phosphoenolpyruvate kinase [Myxococcota bacterium]
MGTSLTSEQREEVLERLSLANQAFLERYPGDSPNRQPLHTVYGGAQLFKATTANKLGELATRSMDAYAPDAPSFARALGLPGSADLPDEPEALATLAKRFAEAPDLLRVERPGSWLAYAVYERVRDKLAREPVEDFRIDFEDGFGVRPDAEEDATAERAALETARGITEGILPPFIGIRIKPLNEEMKVRSIRTLDLYLSTLVRETAGILPDGFVVTLPKVTIPEQVSSLVAVFEQLEGALDLPPGTLQMEIMIETTQSMFDPAGRSNLPHLLEAARGRCVGAHFGTYDYTASCNITAAYQAMDHPVCDFAKHMMQVTLSGTGIFLSDGATNVMPVGPHSGGELTAEQRHENQA